MSTLYLLTGDPFLCKFYEQKLVKDLKADALIKVRKDLEINEIRSIINNHYLFYDRPAIIISQINKAISDMLVDYFAKKKDNHKIFIFNMSEHALDGKLRISSFLSKESTIKNFPNVSKGETDRLFKIFKEELQSCDETAQQWILSKAPTELRKDEKDSRKESLIYNLDFLYNELVKLQIVYEFNSQKITLNQAKSICCFQYNYDIWEYINNCIKGDKKYIRQLFEHFNISSTNAGTLYLMRSQLEFYLKIKSLKTNDINSIVDDLSMKTLAGYYYDENFALNPMEFKEPNFWRVKFSLETISQLSYEQLENMYLAISNAILDFRTSINENIIMTYLQLALMGHIKYREQLITI